MTDAEIVSLIESEGWAVAEEIKETGEAIAGRRRNRGEIMSNRLQKQIDVLVEGYVQVVSKIVAMQIMKTRGTDEVRKQAESIEFMNSLFSGKMSTAEHPYEVEFKKMAAYVEAINALTELGGEES